MANRFKDKTMRKEYDAVTLMYTTKHRNLFLENGSRRTGGSSMADHFWRGYDGTPMGKGFIDRASRSTLAYAYFRAGQDAARQMQEDGKEKNGSSV